MSALNIILLSGKKGEGHLDEGEYPEYLSEFDGKPLIQHLIENCAELNPSKIICMFSNSEATKLHLRNMVQHMHPLASVLPIHDVTEGAACTALLASELIDNDDELLILSTTEFLDVALATVVDTFRKNSNDAGVAIFKSLHPRYSFVRLTPDNLVIEAAEKNPISPHAIAGLYWFKSGAVFVSAVKDMIRKDARVNNHFFIAPSLNELVLQHRTIGSYRLSPAQYRPLKTQSQLQAFEIGMSR
jgi:dTDP-glucose pyrophosphorylase